MGSAAINENYFPFGVNFLEGFLHDGSV